MKFLRPSPSSNKTSQAKPNTFGQARAEKLAQRAEHAKAQRIKLTRAQFVAPDPVNKAIENKVNLLERNLQRLKSE